MKFSDDTVLLSLLTKNSNLNTYYAAVENCVAWYDQLQINISKTGNAAGPWFSRGLWPCGHLWP